MHRWAKICESGYCQVFSLSFEVTSYKMIKIKHLVNKYHFQQFIISATGSWQLIVLAYLLIISLLWTSLTNTKNIF